MRSAALAALFALPVATLACAPSVDSSPGDSSSSASSSSSSSGAPIVSCTPGETETCYSGPSATLGVGPCHAGTRTCLADGHGFGPCEGEVAPAPEACASVEDVDCDGVTGCSGDTLWKLPFEGSVQPEGIAASPDGEATVFGWATDVDIGTGPQGNPNTWRFFVARIGADGSPRWLRTFEGVDASTRTGGVAMNAAHQATVVIYVEGPVKIEGQVLDASPDGVLALRFEDDGTLAAARLVDLSGPPALLPPWARVARIAGDGGVLIAGAGFTARLGDDLSTTWHRRYASLVSFSDLAIDAGGRVFAAGWYTSSFEPGGGAAPIEGHDAGFVAELAGADVAWSETVGGDVPTLALAVAASPSGELVIGGRTEGGGELIDGLDITWPTGFLASRSATGALDSASLGFGPRAAANVTLDAAGDQVVRAVPLQGTLPVFLLKRSGASYPWARPFFMPAVSVTLPSGETIVASGEGVEKLDR